MVISLHKFFATTSINMRTAVVYIKTQRWMFNQSCMNIFGLPHSWGKREFLFYICMRSMHKTLLWFWMKVWTESICKLFDLTKRSLQGQMIVDTYIFCVLSIPWIGNFHIKSQEIFSMFCQNLTATFSKSHPIKTEKYIVLLI